MNYDDNLTKMELVKMMDNDDIGRNKYLLKCLEIISKNGSNRIFSLNGNWGSGKTIFIKKMELMINYCSLYDNNELKRDNVFSSYFKDVKYEDITELYKLLGKDEFNRFNKIVNDNLINAIYFNAWEHDDEYDSIISIIYEFINRFHLIEDTKNVKDNGIASKISCLINCITAGRVNIDKIFNSENILEDIERKHKVKELLQNVLDDIINENCNKIVLFIDELDRCKPTYAINLLERIRHFFNDDRIVIVVSTNLLELSNTISSLYGNNFSSSKYLDKFFDMRLELPKIDTNKYIESFDLNINRKKSNWFSIIVNEFITFEKLEMREINHYLSTLRFFEERICNVGNNLSFYRYKTVVKTLFIPYIVGLYIVDVKKYDKFINNNGWDNFKNYIMNNEHILRYCRFSLFPENSKPIEEIEAISNDIVIDNVEKLYGIIFNIKNKKDYEEVKVGWLTIANNSFEGIYDSISLLGNLSDFTLDDKTALVAVD